MLGVAAASSRRAWSLRVLLLGVFAAVILYREMWTNPFGSTLGSVDHTNDPLQMMWFLKWVPWQLLHGRNPFTTDALFYPDGVSLSWNTLVPTLGLAAAPLTFATTASFSFAVLITLGPALTALTGFWWLRRYVDRSWAAAAGGLLLGFNPYMSGHLLGHLNLVFTCLLPLMLMLAEDLVWRRPRSQRRSSVYLGVVTAVQLGISEELVLILVVGVAVVVVFSLAVKPALTWTAARAVSGWALVSIAVMVIVSSPLLISQLILSPTVTVDTTRFRATPVDFVHASVRQQFGLGTATRTSALGGAEHGVYLGWPVVVVLVVGVVVTYRRDPWIRVAAGTAVILVVLCMFPVFGNVPALESVLPARYSFALFFVVAWMMTRWCDRAKIGRSIGPVAPGTAVAVAVAAMALAVISLTPSRVSSYPLPAASEFFGSAWRQSHLPSGTPLLLLPAGDARGMYYQQRAEFSFLQPGGYALLPTGGRANSGPGRLLVQLSDQARYRAVDDPAQLTSGRRALCSLSLQAVVVMHSAAEVSRLTRLATDLMHRGPDHDDDGVSVWLITCPLAPDQ